MTTTKPAILTAPRIAEIKVRHFSDSKLDMELSFARAARDDSWTQNLAWLAALEAEAVRRNQEVK